MKGSDSFIVRFPDPDGKGSVGVGALVGREHVVTCAHVVNKALGRDKREQGKPIELVKFAFPFLDHGAAEKPVEARVEAWRPPPPRPGDAGDDIAGLIIEGKPPDGATPAQLATRSPRPGAALWVWGPPSADRYYGTRVETVMRGRVVRGRLHLDSIPGSSHQVGPGFSGGPVLDARDHIVGLVSEFAMSNNDSYPVGANVLRKAWPDVLGGRRRGRILLAGSAGAGVGVVAAAAGVLLSYSLTGTAEISSIAVGGSPEAVGVDPAIHTAYVTNWKNESVEAINTETNAVAPAIPVGHTPASVAADPAVHTVYVANGTDATVEAIDTATHATTTINVGHAPGSLSVDPVAHKAYVANSNDNSVSVINTETNSVAATVSVGDLPSSVAVDPADHKAYVANLRGNSVSVINTETNAVDTVPIGMSPFAVGIDPDAHAAYVTATEGASVLVMNTATDTPTPTTIDVGKFPVAVAVDPATHTAYVVNNGGNSVSVINTETNSVAATVRVGSEPHDVAVDPTTHTAYVTNSGNGSVSIIRARA